MIVTPANLLSNINTTLLYLFNKDVMIDINSHSIDSTSGIHTITYNNISDVDLRFVGTTIEKYLYLLKKRQFSAVFMDGSLLQVSYNISRRKICAHRLCYYPCPIVIDSSELEGLPIGDFLEVLEPDEINDRFIQKSFLRFDYDPEREQENHPGSHLHLNHQSCRIPVRSYWDFSRFIKFLCSNFYSDYWEDIKDNAPLVRHDPALSILDIHAKEPHIHWQ